MNPHNNITGNCSSCQVDSSTTHRVETPQRLKKYPALSFLSTLFLIIIPKCPLCIMAYTGTFAFMVDVEYASLSALLKYSQPVLIAFVLGSVLFNYRGIKTIYASVIILIASFFVIYESFTLISIIDKKFAIAAMFIAVWINGNFVFFLSAIRNGLSKLFPSLLKN